ncbi:MAG: VWA domain-containing protein [Treponematales bacterium]
MRKRIQALSLLLTLALGMPPHGASAQTGGPADIIMLLDTSRSMSGYYGEVSDYLTGPFLKQFLRLGDTFHLISFGGKAQVEITRRVGGAGDVETIAARLLLMYPLEPASDVAGALQFAGKYAASLPGDRRKRIVLLTSAGEEVRELVSAAAARLRGQGTELQFIPVPPPLAAQLESPAAPSPTAVPPTPSVPQPALPVEVPPLAAAASPAVPRPSSGVPLAAAIAGGGVVLLLLGGIIFLATKRCHRRPDRAVARAAVPPPRPRVPAPLAPCPVPAAVSAPEKRLTVKEQTKDAARAAQETPPAKNAPVKVEQMGKMQQTQTVAKAKIAEAAQSAKPPAGASPVPTALPLPPVKDALVKAETAKSAKSPAGFTAKPVVASPPSAASPPAGFTDRPAGAFLPPPAVPLSPLTAPPLLPLRQFRPLPKDAPDENEGFDGPLVLRLFVEGQTTAIGRRNIHEVKPGAALTIGGGRSDFLIFLVPMPPAIAELRFDGAHCVFVPRKPKYFPDIGSHEVPKCLGKTIRVISDRNYELHIRIERYHDPLVTLNRLLNSVSVPG